MYNTQVHVAASSSHKFTLQKGSNRFKDHSRKATCLLYRAIGLKNFVFNCIKNHVATRLRAYGFKCTTEYMLQKGKRL